MGSMSRATHDSHGRLAQCWRATAIPTHGRSIDVGGVFRRWSQPDTSSRKAGAILNEELVRGLVAQLVAGLHDRDRLLKTQIVKFLYLIDLEWVKATGAPLTGIEWQFHYFGPWSNGIETTLRAMASLGEVECQDYAAADGHPYTLYGEGEVGGVTLPPAVVMVTRHILGTYRDYPLRSLLDEVVYQTPPMRGAARGAVLDLGAIGRYEEDLSFVHGGSAWGPDA